MAEPERRPPHPFLYFILFLPFGATNGYIAVTIGYLASHAGIGDAAISAMVATNTLPHTWKFAWAPIVDAVWTGRGWYVSTNLVSSLAILATGLVPLTSDNVGILEWIIFINGLATTFVGMTTEALMAHLTPPEQRGAAAGWSQAGNVGGSLVGGLALLLAEQVDQAWIPAAAVAAGLMACSLVLIGMGEPPDAVRRPKLGATVRELFKDLKSLLWSRTGAIAIGLCFLPIGSGGALGLFSAMADEWHTSASVVSFSNGLGSGIAAIIGSLLGGKLSDKIERRRAYAVSGVTLAVVTVGMAVAPHTAPFYVAGVIAYNLGLGMCYATFTGFVLEIIGKGAAATKYNVFASLANIPIYAMGLLDGYVAETYGRESMLWFDGGAGVIGAILLLAIVAVVKLQRPAPAPE